MTRKSLLGLCSALVLTLLTTSLYSFAQRGESLGGPRIRQQIDDRAYVTLKGNTRPEAMNAVNYRGPLEANHPIDHILMFLQRSPEQEQAVDQFITSLNDRNSPNFHKWLTAEEYGERFGVDESDIREVTNWLESQGFQINQVYTNRMVIDFSGTAGQILNAFRTQMAHLDVGGEAHIANLSDPQIPSALAPVIKGFASLNDFRPHAMHKSIAQYTFAGCTSSTSTPTEPGTCYAMTPQDNQTIYNLTPLYTAGYSGQGQTIALVEDTDSYGTDWQTYRHAFGLDTAFPEGNYVQLHPNCSDPGTNGDDGEANIDVEIASAIAPSANIQLIACPSGTVTFGGQIALLNLLNASGPYPGVVSVSYGVCEVANGNGGNAAFTTTYQQAAAQGVSVFGASGDEGPSSCSVDFSVGSEYDVTSLGISGWTSTNYNVSVGGTDFEDVYNAKLNSIPLSTYWNSTNSSNYGSAKSYIPEIPWNDACASTLIADYVTGNFTTYGSSGFCRSTVGTAGYLSTGAASGGASNCYSGSGGTNSSSYLISEPQCQGLPKPSFQTGSALTGGKAVYGMPSDAVRDIPDVSMFAANGVWGHYEIVCWSDPAYTSTSGAASCSGAPSTWSGFGGTSIASPSMAAIQALVNQKTGESWGNPLSYYYQMAQNEYGTAGGTFQGSGCNSSTGSGSTCVFNDVTQGDIDLACRYNGTVGRHHCYSGSAAANGVDSTDVITAATVINGGSGYTTAPTCTIAGPTNSNAYKTPTGTTLWAGGTQATCTTTVSASTTTAVWTADILATGAAGMQIQLTNPAGTTTCGPYTLTGASTAAICTNLVSSIGTGCSLATASSSSCTSASTATITARTAGYAGDFITQFGNNGTLFQQGYVTIINTTLGQGPNYVSGITISGGGSGYQPETPITFGGPGSGAVAVANTTPGTAASTYQPAYGAAPGYDMATGLGSPNAYNFVCSSVWGTSCSTSTSTSVSSSENPSNYGDSVSFTATVMAGSNPVTAGTVQFVVDGSNFGSPVSLNGSGQATSGSTTSLSVGTHTVTANYSGSGSYQSSSGSLSGGQVVNQASQTINFTTNAPATAAYNSSFGVAATATSGLTVAFTASGSCSVVDHGDGTATYTMTSGSGSCSVIANQAGNSDYLAAPQVTQFTTATQLTLTVTATSTSKNYGDPVPTLTYTMTGFVGSDNQGNSTTGQPNESTTATQSSNVGSYPINISIGSLASNNYTFTFVNGTLAVNTVQLTVTANNTGITYGCGCSPTLTYMITGFVLGQNQGTATTGQPNESTTGNQGAAGSYPIVITQGTLQANNNNYTFSFVNGTLTVSQATLTVTADNKTITQGQDLPTFTASYSGFVNGDNQSNLTGAPAFSTDAQQDPPVGTYNIFVMQGTLADPNYTFAFVNGTLTVNPAVAQFVSPPKNTMLSGASVNFTWSHETNAVSYTLNLGSTPGGSDIASVTTPNLNATVNNLPTDGSYIYATLLGSTDGTNYTQQDTALYVAYSVQAVMISPMPGTTFSGSSVTFTWVAGAGSSAYWLDVGSVPGGNTYEQSGNLGTALTLTVNNLPTDGSAVYVTLWSLVNGNWVYNEYQYTAYNNGSTRGQMTSPAPGSQFTGTTVTFNWSAGTQSTAYWLDIGNTSGGNQYYQSGNLGNSLTATVNNLPNDGSTVYVTLYSLVNGNWVYNEYQYTAYSLSSGAGQIYSPAPGGTLPGATVTFNWTPGSQATAYWLDAGNTPGGNQYFQSGNLGNVTTVTVNNLPTDGSTVYVTLYSLIGGQWIANAYTYTAFTQGSGLAVMQTPPPGTEIDGYSATFTWSAGTNAQGYWLDIGSNAGGNQYYQSGNLGLTQSTVASGLPNDGSQIFVTLYTLINGTWYSNGYTYQSGQGQMQLRPAGPKQQLKQR